MSLVVRETGACSDVGQLRQSNEDALVLSDPVFAVADGMGGARAGEVASAMTVAALHDLRGGEPELVAAIKHANARIHTSAQADPTLMGMGTTVTAAIIDGDDLVIAHVGDSRAYLYRGDRLQQLTDDHSLVGELIRRGALTPAEAERHPQRSVITRALGAEGAVDVDVQRLRPEPGDVYLLCSDGLTGMVDDSELRRILGRGESLERTAQLLVGAANGAGGEDNVTVVLLRVGLREPDETDPGRLPAVIVPASALQLAPDGGGALHLEMPAPAPADGSRTLLIAGIVAALGIVIAVLVAVGLQWSHFVGTTPTGSIAVYQGLPVEITSDLTLYRPVVVSGIPAAALDSAERADLLDHRIGSRSGAVDRVAALAKSSPWLITPPTAR